MSATHDLRGMRVLHLAAADSMLNPNLRDQLIFLREQGLDVHTASIDGPLARRLHLEDKFPWTPLPLTREFAPLSDLRAVRFIERLCKRARFDLVHTHTPKGNLVGQWGARLAEIPRVVQTLHGFYFHDRMPLPKRRAWIEIEKFSASFSDHIFCQNPEDVETALREEIAPPSMLSELGNGTDLQRFTPVTRAQRDMLRARLNIPAHARVVGMVGRFVKEKGFPEFVNAARILSKDYPDVHFLAVGHRLSSERGGDAFSPEENSLPQRFIVLTDRDDMPELYACMDIHVLPSHREGFPRSLIEGAATGLPQVATAIRGCRQVIREGLNGLLVEPKDAQALALAIKTQLDDPELRETMGQNSRRIAVEQFNQSLVFRRIIGIYRSLFH